MNFGEQFHGARVLVTGGLGFIGSHLACRLRGWGAAVTVIDSLVPDYGGNLHNLAGMEDRIKINICDVRDRHAIDHLIQEKDYLFNLAGQTSHLDSMRDPHTDLDINAASQLSIVEACRQHNPAVRLVFASTRQVYGRPRELPVTEDHVLDPVDVNGINKLAGEWYHLLYHRVYHLPVTVLRLTNTYGPCMRIKDARQTFLGIWIRRLLEGEPFQIFGDGRQRRDFNYVEDAVDAMAAAALSEHAVGRVFNLGSSEVVSLRELADLLVDANGGGRYEMVPFPPARKAIDIGDYYGSFDRFHKATGWRPRIPLREGLERTLAYFQRERAHYLEPAAPALAAAGP